MENCKSFSIHGPGVGYVTAKCDDRKRLEEELVDAKTSLRITQRQRDEYCTAWTDAHIEFGLLKKEFSETKNILKVTQDDRDRLKRERNLYFDDNSRLVHERDSLEKELAESRLLIASEQSMSKMQAEFAQKQRVACEHARKELAELRLQHANAKNESGGPKRDDLLQTISNLNCEIANMAWKIAGVEAERDRLKKELEASKATDYAEVVRDRDRYLRAANGLERERDKAVSDWLQMRDRFDEADNARIDALSECEASQKCLAGHRATIQILERRNHILMSGINGLTDVLKTGIGEVLDLARKS